MGFWQINTKELFIGEDQLLTNIKMNEYSL
jgi:hypothetical protein